MKILVADKLSRVGLDWLDSQDDVEVTSRPGVSPDELADIVGDFDGLIVRSGAKVTAEVLARADKLRAISRAGVGVDNIDVPAATARGVLVMNTPGGNTLATAELTLTLMMALSRKVAPASASLKAGRWERKAFQGTQLAGKTLGVVGMGRIGRAVAARAVAMEMCVLAYDPYLAVVPGEGDVEVVKDLADLCRRADYITVHVPKTPETAGLIGAEQIALMKPTVRLINAARGGIIDESALADALEAGKIAGAGLDVYTAEPPESAVHRRLIEHPDVLAVPHLGASTAEAQEQVALDAGQQLVEALRGGEVRNAINAPGFGGRLPEVLQPYTELAARMGALLSGITPGALMRVEVLYRGPIAGMNVAPVTTHLLVGLLARCVDEPVNVVNAPVLAAERGVELETITAAKSRDFANMMEVTIHTDLGSRHAAGTIFGTSSPRVVELDGYRMELQPVGHVAILFNEDRPGVIGRYGTVLGEAGINIADMTVARMGGDMAAVGLNLDAAMPREVIDRILAIDFVTEAHVLHLPPLKSNGT